MKQEEPLLSIITVTYNSAEYIREAINSILKSDYQKFEVIIVDDHSTDNTWRIVQEFTDTRIKATRNNRNIGEYANRNFCISKAKGKYFIFVDGDDFLLEKGLKETIQKMEQNPSCAMGIVRPEKENLKSPVLLTPNESYYRHFLEKSPLNLSFVRNIFKTKIVQSLGGLPTNIYSGDDYIRLRLAAEYDCLLLTTPFAEWRQRPGQATERKGKTFKGILEPYQINTYFLFQDFCPLKESQRNKAASRIRNKMILHSLVLMKNGKLNKGLRLFIRSRDNFTSFGGQKFEIKFS